MKLKTPMKRCPFTEARTLQGLLDELDTIELFEALGHGCILGEVTKKQEGIYRVLGVNPPSL